MSKLITCPTCSNEYESGDPHFKRVKASLKPGRMSVSELEANLRAAREDCEMLLLVVQRAYAKHHLNSENIGWDELATEMADALSNAMGQDEFSSFLELNGGDDTDVPHLGRGGRE